MKVFVFVTLAALLAGGILAPDADAQVLKRLRDRAAEKVEEKVGEKQDEAIEKAIDGKPAPRVEESTPGDSPQAPASDAASPAGTAPALRPGEGVWANYDFVPGERVVFAEDYARDRIGNFPQRLEWVEGTSEIVEWQSRRWLRVLTPTAFIINLPEVLAERFTMEFESTIGWWGFAIFSEGEIHQGGFYDAMPHHYIFVSGYDIGIHRGQSEHGTSKIDPRTLYPDLFDEEGRTPPFTFRIQADGAYMKMYMEENRIANIPRAEFPRTDRLIVQFNHIGETPVLFGNFSVNAGGSEMYDALVAEGRFSTQGIYFDVGSDRILPESTPTLREIGEMLQKHPDLRLQIQGHTDNTGSAELNQKLSEQRAAAVKTFLVGTFKIDGSRMETQGFGPSQPIDTSETPEGRKMNRRVELVRL